MLRRLSALLAAAAGATVLLAGGPVAAAAPAAVTAPPATCSGVVRINSLAFSPAQVAPGQTSQAALTATNCTGVTQAVTETWTARWGADASGGVPQGCPILDPFLRSVSFAPYTRVTTSTGYLVLSGCTADRLTVTVTLRQGTTLLGQRSADLVIT
ncbi:hypothetical protein AB0M29_27275 [Streptomyces sp. NPDC051976]|uniref:hypothetical protein n=1 Tax=Streptomyces sp. NPDC051976 TaxID=3154947 RepID=UPI00343727F5